MKKAKKKKEKINEKRKAGGIGSSFDDFLKADGIYEGVTARAIKRALARNSTS
jgi:antitoxin HicB